MPLRPASGSSGPKIPPSDPGVSSGVATGVPAPNPRTKVPLRASLTSLLGITPPDLSGPTILGFINPAAQDGKIKTEIPELRRIMGGARANFLLVETVPQAEERRELFRTTTLEAIEQWGPIRVMPFGGDSHVGQTVEGTLRALGISLAPGMQSSDATSLISTKLPAFIVPKKGTAADIAVELGSPSQNIRIPKFIQRGVGVPFRIPIIDGSEVAIHSFGVGASGYLFAVRQRNKEANPTGWWNQGLKSYLRLIPHAVINRYGLFGVDYELTRSNFAGEILEQKVVRGADIQISPRRIVAAVGGVPGAWGDTKMVILPPHGPGLVALSEFIGRGLLTKLGFNLVGPQSRLRTLSPERQWLIGPEDKITVKARVPNSKSFSTLAWWVLRAVQDFKINFEIAGPETEIPAAGKPVEIPTQINGDVTGTRSEFTVTAPNMNVTMWGDPNCLAVRLARASALYRDEVPPISDKELVASTIPNSWAMMSLKSGRGSKVRTTFISQPRLRHLMQKFKVPLEQQTSLLIASEWVEGRTNLFKLGNPELNIGSMQEFLDSDAGQNWLQENPNKFGMFRERLLEGGLPLATGVLALYGAEKIADALRLDSIKHRELRFGLVVYLSHAAQANVAPIWEVASNRILNKPYDFVRLRNVKVAGETLTQWTLESDTSLRRALWVSWKSGSLGAGLGLRHALLPLSAAWNMGEGLIFSKLAESLASYFPENSSLRQYGPAAAFFLPDVSRILAPETTMTLFETGTMRLAAKAFAAGFISDMAFIGIHRLVYGDKANDDQTLNLRAGEIRRQQGDMGPLSWRWIPRILAPSLAAYMDSHDFLFGEENGFKKKLREQDAQQSLLMEKTLRNNLPWLAKEMKCKPQEILAKEIQLDRYEKMMMEDLDASRRSEALREDANFEETAVFLLSQFSGVIHSQEVARSHLAKIYAYQLQKNIAARSHYSINDSI